MTRKRKGRRAGKGLAADMMLAPAVVAMRMPMLLAELSSFTPFRGETFRAWSEKASAASEGLFAAQLSYAASAARFWPELASGRIPSVMSGAAAELSMEAALAPAGRQVRANHKRLSGNPGR